MLSTYLLHWWNHANLGHEAELKCSMRNITIVRKRTSWGWSCPRELRRDFMQPCHEIPYAVLCGPSTHQCSTTEELQGCGCPAAVGALCYRTKHTPSPGVRQGEGGIAAGPAAASGPQVSELMRNHLCELRYSCCFLSASKPPKGLPVPILQPEA